jgi:capsule polysaccharide export protein KpsE/RkpR
MPNADNLTILHEHIILENKLRDSEEIWAFRIYDVYRDKVFFEKPDGVMMSLPFRDYLDYYNQNLLRNITRQIERVQAIKKWII